MHIFAFNYVLNWYILCNRMSLEWSFLELICWACSCLYVYFSYEKCWNVGHVLVKFELYFWLPNVVLNWCKCFSLVLGIFWCNLKYACVQRFWVLKEYYLVVHRIFKIFILFGINRERVNCQGKWFWNGYTSVSGFSIKNYFKLKRFG
jgi:hypothetical protein